MKCYVLFEFYKADSEKLNRLFYEDKDENIIFDNIDDKKLDKDIINLIKKAGKKSNIIIYVKNYYVKETKKYKEIEVFQVVKDGQETDKNFKFEVKGIKGIDKNSIIEILNKNYTDKIPKAYLFDSNDEIYKLLNHKKSNKINTLKYKKQLILQGPPGTGKTRLAKQIAIKMIDSNLSIDTNEDIKNSLSKINNEQIKLIQFHPSYSYEDFVRGIVAKVNNTNNQIEYKAENKILAEMAKKALDNPDKKYILIIDEINRANLSSVLGELIYALEYRDEAVESMYEVDGSKEIILPSNLYIIGTMNTADRSIGHIDYAIRRRFAFESILPNEDSIKLEKGKELFNKVKKLFKTDDNKIASTLSPEFNPDDVMLGHSYFIADNDNELDNKLKYQVIPLLKEYVKDGVLNESALDLDEVKNLG